MQSGKTSSEYDGKDEKETKKSSKIIDAEITSDCTLYEGCP